MSKEAQQYIEIDPWIIREKGFNKKKTRESESLFSLGNEYMGLRGYFDEGYGGDSLQGAYFNGVYEYRDVQHPTGREFLGMVHESHFMVNSVNWLHTRIRIGKETLDLSKSKTGGFERWIDLREGVLHRSFVWKTSSGKELKIHFERMTCMSRYRLGVQRITLEPLNFSGAVSLEWGLDFGVVHEEEDQCFWQLNKSESWANGLAGMARTVRSGQSVFSSMRVESSYELKMRKAGDATCPALQASVRLKKGVAVSFDRFVVNYVEKSAKKSEDHIWDAGEKQAKKHLKVTYEQALAEQRKYWESVWMRSDVVIEGDPENQQGIRFCMFHLHQAYHGVDASLNVSAKGLTGEKYSGWTWWDTETYCLPFFMFTNSKAAKNLLSYRHRTLKGAVSRAKELDCQGARYPMATINGDEAVGVWQHGDLEIHVSAAVAYGLWHYERVIGDSDFIFSRGIEILLQISRYYASRGNWGQVNGEFGFFGVMGADEFHMMVNNNCYTNVMAKKSFEYTLDVVKRMRRKAPEQLAKVLKKTSVTPEELRDWKLKARKMHEPMDEKTGIYEQHEGYFNLPHVDVGAIPPQQFPLYKHWAYVRIFRYDMSKQPDFLLLQFLFNGDYSQQSKLVNYNYYEPRCSHESSLSPSIHSILAAELGMHEKAFSFMKHATRLDLDDYNRNVHEGVHTTSMAAAWMNICYGFGGMRSDGDLLSFAPSMPKSWNKFSFKVTYRGSLLEVCVKRKEATFCVIEGSAMKLKIFGKFVNVGSDVVKIGFGEL